MSFLSFFSHSGPGPQTKKWPRTRVPPLLRGMIIGAAGSFRCRIDCSCWCEIAASPLGLGNPRQGSVRLHRSQVCQSVRLYQGQVCQSVHLHQNQVCQSVCLHQGQMCWSVCLHGVTCVRVWVSIEARCVGVSPSEPDVSECGSPLGFADC